MPVLSLKNVSYHYPGGFGLKSVNLEIPKATFTGIIGPNGSGKTTLLRLMSGLLVPQEGEVLVDDINLRKLPPRDLAKTVSVISSEQYFEFPFQVHDVVAMGRYPHLGRLGAYNAKDREVILRSLALTDTLHLNDRSIAEISSGERQRVLLARALCQETPILMLDEPNAHLDIHHEIAIFSLLHRLNRDAGLTIVVILHNLMAAAAFCRHIVLMHHGRVKHEGSPKEVITADILEETYGATVAVHPSPVGGYPQISYLIDLD